MISDEWYHHRDSFSEGVAFVHIELYLRKAHTQKPLVMFGKSILNNNHPSWRHGGRANPKGVRLGC